MKKFTVISNIVILVAVAALYVLFFTVSPKTAKSEATNGSEITAQKGDIVYIQLDSLVNQYDMYNDLRSEFEGKISAVDNDLNKKGRALENDIKSFEEKMGKGLLTRSQAETMQQDLIKRQQDLQALSQQKSMEMAEEERVLINKVMDAISSYIEEYNKEHQFSLIISTSNATNAVKTGDNSLNITNEIINGINAQYIKTRNRK